MHRVLPSAINLFGFSSFVFFASLQREDTNPTIYANPSRFDVISWTTFYGLVALLFALALFRRFPAPLYGLVAVFCFFQFLVTGPGLMTNLASGSFAMTADAMSPDYPEVELTREFFGAVIALTATAFLWWQRRLVASMS